MSLGEGELKRIALTVSCRDTDSVPKVPDAGEVRDGLQVMHNGVLVRAGCYYGDWMTEVIRQLRGHHEPQEELAYHAVVERVVATEAEPVILELGAFWAYYSLWLLHRQPSTRAFLVEPDPAYLEVGRENFDLNGRTGVFLQAAVGARPEPPQPFWCESDGETRPVPTEGLGSLLARFGLDRVDILLVDVQGAEAALLDAGRELLAEGRVRFVVVSTHHHVLTGDPRTHQRCLDVLDAAGAHVVAEHTVAESFSGDGLIVAAFDDRDRDLVVEVSRARACDSLFGDPLDDLAACRDQLAVAEATRGEAEARAAAAEAELAAVRGTRTWRLRDRVLRWRSRDGGAPEGRS